jgi:hypothetical protein
MKKRHILLIILAIFLLIFLFFPALKLANGRQGQQNQSKHNEGKNLKITIYRYSPAKLPPCEERFYLILNQAFIHSANLPVCLHTISKPGFI